ncbi:hypothetical protein O6H91_18G060200 [Diphasiastrum complanatum]|uniref:Uncharacterized protein n=1 Tax=Diphasiastrum complanatum TaxID=34168 RepID=A0ACC2B1P0_DIPCM|nr:hypothetical protein O6H91_18G060200 [Diphasiastrum complanatum]
MGITLAVSIPACIFLGTFIAVRDRAPNLLLAPLLHSSLIFLSVSISSHPRLNHRLLFAKTPQGSFPWWSRLLFHPYLLSAQAYVALRRLATLEPLYTEICDGIFVGGWPLWANDMPPGNPAVIDCTCELPRRTLTAHLPYLCIPTWDTRAPSPTQIEVAVRWAVEKRAHRYPVYIHCAFGHGRSVTVVCALLMALGVVETWRDAENLVKRHRPCIRLNKPQKESLQEWSKFGAGQKKSQAK